MRKHNNHSHPNSNGEKPDRPRRSSGENREWPAGSVSPRGVLQHLRKYIFNGLLAIIPLLLCVLAVQLLYSLIDRRVLEFLNVRQIPGLGILLLLISLYIIGLVVSNVLGHGFLRFLENITRRIPLIGSIYNVGKQLSQSIIANGSQKQSFKKVVLMRLDTHHEVWCPVFVMSSSTDSQTGEELFFVFVPTAPTPAGGLVFVTKASQTIDPGWSVEEGLKIILSMGLISPKELDLEALSGK